MKLTSQIRSSVCLTPTVWRGRGDEDVGDVTYLQTLHDLRRRVELGRHAMSGPSLESIDNRVQTGLDRAGRQNLQFGGVNRRGKHHGQRQSESD
jgi:hypothetical protein